MLNLSAPSVYLPPTQYSNSGKIQKGNKNVKRIIVCLLLGGAALTASSADVWAQAKAAFPKGSAETHLSFEDAFPKPFYKTSYFGPMLTGATIVLAGGFTYFTAGAGAPVAATGVSSVAAWLGGGGAGSYMAGLSTLGGWFGGNAVLGSAILNGISIGVTGGGAAFATLPAIAKVGVMASVAATALDGVAVFQKPETKNLSYRIRVAVPNEMGSKDIRTLTKKLNAVEVELIKELAEKSDKAYIRHLKERASLLKEGVKIGRATLKNGGSNEDRMALAILSKNAGYPELFKKLVDSIPTGKMKDSGYVDYLKAVDLIERGNTEKSISLLRKSWRLNPYALEQPLLLLNILGHQNFVAKEEEIRAIVAQARRDFNSNKYESSFSLVSLNFRLASMYLSDKRFPLAQQYFQDALDELSFIQKHLGNQSMKHMIQLGIANALFGQDKVTEANQKLETILKEVKNETEKSFIESQYAGNI